MTLRLVRSSWLYVAYSSPPPLPVSPFLTPLAFPRKCFFSPSFLTSIISAFHENEIAFPCDFLTQAEARLLEQIMAAPPPPSTYTAISITLGVAALALVLRFCARRMQKKRLWYDDYFCMVAFVSRKLP